MPRSQRRFPAWQPEAAPGWILVLLALCLLLPAASGAAAAVDGAFALLASDAAGARFAYEGEPAGGVRLDDGTVVFHDHRHPETPMAPDLQAPWAGTWIAAPPGSRLSFSLSITSSDPVEWPDGVGEEQRRRVLSALSADGGFPGAPCWTRTQWGASFGYCPLIPDGRGGLRQVRRAVIQVRFDTRGTVGGAEEAGDPMESFYARRFLNAEQARGWRQLPPGAAKAAQADTSDYFTSTSHPWIKVYVPRRGIYEIRGEDLRSLGITETIDASSLRLFCAPPAPLDEATPVQHAPSWMHEVPCEVDDGGDGNLDAADTIRFFGQGPDGWYDELGVPATPLERYHWDPYNNQNVYWLTWGGTFHAHARPLRMAQEDRSQITEPAVPQVRDRAHFARTLIWDPRPRDATSTDPSQTAAWEAFHWMYLSANSLDRAQFLRVTPLDPVVTSPAEVRLRFWGASFNSDPIRPWPDHTVQVSLNGNSLPARSWDSLGHMDVDSTGLWLVQGTQELQILLPYRPDPPYADSSRFDLQYLSWVEMDYWRQLIARGDTLSFFAGGISGAQTLELNGFTRSDVVLLDTSDPWNPVRLLPSIDSPGSGVYRARFRTVLREDPPSTFLACTGGTLVRPVMAVYQPPEGGYLRGRTAAVQGLIITHKNFLQAGEALAAFRRDHFPGVPGASVEVLDVQDIMDEFAFGRTDPTGLRNFLQYARGAWNGGRPARGPSMVVFLGGAHYDYRNALGKGAQSFVPTYEGYYDAFLALDPHGYPPQYASDDFFGYLDGPQDTGLDLYLGRLPARTLGEATTMVNKIISYEGTPARDPWKSRLTLIADDICQGTRPDNLGFTHMVQTESLAVHLPPVFQKDKIYLYEYGSACIYDRKPAASAALEQRISEGTLMVNFTGHGSEEQLADERVLETADVAGMTNFDRLFILFTASCAVGKYDFFGQGLGTSLLLHAGGGAIAVFSAAAIAYSGGNAALDLAFFKNVFPDSLGGPSVPVGESAALAKGSLRDPNSHRYILLADPALRLASPPLKMKLELKDARRQAALGDSLIRGMLTDLTGTVLDQDGAPLTGFDGTVWVRIYDSSIIRRPRSDIAYALTGAPIYHGQATVKDGVFTLRFQVPTALATENGGKAQIFAYAADPMMDAAGSIPRVVVPLQGVQISERQGPRMTLELKGDPRAVQPLAAFSATMVDSSGINITDLVGARSVVAQVEEDGQLISATDLSSNVVFPQGYDSALVSGTLPAQLTAGGSYDLVLRASDNLMNSAKARVSFTMAGASTAAFALSGLYNFPNPTEGGTTFYGTVNRDVEVELKIFTLSGREIWHLDPPVPLTAAELANKGIYWDGRDARGDIPANGVYLYKLTAIPAGGTPKVSKVERLVVYRRR